MPEIPRIDIGRVWAETPSLSIPAAPPVTYDIGVPIIDLPSFDPMDFRPEKLVMDPAPVAPQPAPTPPTPAPPPQATPQLPEPAVEVDPRCPPLRAKKVGMLVDNGQKKIASYEIKGNECLVVYETISLREQVAASIPTLPQVVPVAITAAVGVSAALATPLLLKAVKPAVKKAILKIKALLGQKAPLLSVFERRRAQRIARK